MSTNIGNTNQFGFNIIAEVIQILRPHFTSDIENQAKQCRFTNMALMRAGKLKMPKSQMLLNYGRVSFVE